jgi:hypothetical protein
MDTTFKLRVDDGFLVRVKVYAEKEKKSASDVFRDGARLLMDGGVIEGINEGISEGVKPELVVKSVPVVNPLVEELRAKMGGVLIRASELGEVAIVNKPFGGVPSSVVGLSKFSGIKAIAFDKFDRLLEMSTEAGAKEILSMISILEDRMDSL